MDVLIEKEQREKEMYELEKKATHMDNLKKTKMVSSKNDDIRTSSRKSSNLMD